jgi:hypothetical protein
MSAGLSTTQIWPFSWRRVAADIAHLLLGEGAAIGAVADLRHRARQRLRQAHPAAAIALQQGKRHALRRLRANARQTAQCFHKLS